MVEALDVGLISLGLTALGFGGVWATRAYRHTRGYKGEESIRQYHRQVEDMGSLQGP